MPFSSILCCFRSKNPSQDSGEQSEIIDERSHLIPTTDDQPAPTPSLVFIDPEQFRERLETIVRKKEGRMVNVIPNYLSRDHSANPNFSGNQRNRSRISSGISSIRTRSVSTSDSAQDSDSMASPALASTQAPINEDNVHGHGNEGIVVGGGTLNASEIPRAESQEIPQVVISVPRRSINRPVIPVFDDPSVKLSLSWGD